ncbi:MAG: GspH/FimT family protein [Nitrospirae bacterium]|nr:GspH/FimT family protein [Nitrospirota bacterium]
MRDNKGFTIIELMIVVAIIGIIAAIGFVSLTKQIPHYRLNGSVRDLVSDLRWARTLAIASGEKVNLRLDPSNDRYQVEKALNPGTPISRVRDLRQDYPGVDLISSSGGNLITFEPRGTTSSWTTIKIGNSSGEEKKITVIVTGRIKIN